MIETKKFVLAGNATFTITSVKTGSRFTFKVRQPSSESPYFVSLLTGNNNEEDFTFIGTIFPNGKYFHGRRSKIPPEAISAKAFTWFWNHIDQLPTDKISVHHEGKCCRCGRKLTVPESIESGIGPECASKLRF